MNEKSAVFGPVHRWTEGDVLKASNDWISMAYVVTDDSEKVGSLGLHEPDQLCVEYISPAQAALWGSSAPGQ